MSGTGSFDGGYRPPPDPGRPPDDATADEFIAHYRGDLGAIRAELARRSKARLLRLEVENGLELDREPDCPPAPAITAKSRQVTPDGLPPERVELLKAKLRERGAAVAAGGQAPSHLTQKAIANALGPPFNRSRVQQAEKLTKLGWDLKESVEELSGSSKVHWPSPAEAAEILGRR